MTPTATTETIVVKATLSGVKYHPCPHCGGSGGFARKVQKIVFAEGPVFIPGDCPTCRGWAVIKRPEDVANGRFTFEVRD